MKTGISTRVRVLKDWMKENNFPLPRKVKIQNDEDGDVVIRNHNQYTSRSMKKSK